MTGYSRGDNESSIVHRYEIMTGRRWYRMWFVAPAAAMIAVGALTALVIAVVHRNSGSRSAALTPPGTGRQAKIPGPATIGCGMPAPPHASTVSDTATLLANGGRGTWQVTITNQSKTRAALNRKIDLVAVDDQGRVIGETRMPDAGGSSTVLAPHRSWTAAVRPVAEDCSAPPRPPFPTIPAGTYRFVVTFALGLHYLSSDPVLIDVGPDGSFSPH
jgi:hypothetical protein